MEFHCCLRQGSKGEETMMKDEKLSGVPEIGAGKQFNGSRCLGC